MTLPSSCNQALNREPHNTASTKTGLEPGLLLALPALPARCRFLARCHPSQTEPSRPLLSFILESSPSEALAQREQGLAVSLGSGIVPNPGFGFVWWRWGTVPPIPSGEGQMCKCQHEIGPFKGERVTPKLLVNAQIHRKWLLGSFRRKALWAGGGLAVVEGLMAWVGPTAVRCSLGAGSLDTLSYLVWATTI